MRHKHATIGVLVGIMLLFSSTCLGFTEAILSADIHYTPLGENLCFRMLVDKKHLVSICLPLDEEHSIDKSHQIWLSTYAWRFIDVIEQSFPGIEIKLTPQFKIITGIESI